MGLTEFLTDPGGVAVIIALLGVPGAWFSARAANRKSDAEMLGAVDARVKMLMDAQAREIDLLRKRVEGLEQQLDASRLSEQRLRERVEGLERALVKSRDMEQTLRDMLKRVLAALRKHDPLAAEEIERDYPNLGL